MIYEGIDRWNSPYIEHHGVKGMKWGVRKQIQRVGSGIRSGVRGTISDLADRNKKGTIRSKLVGDSYRINEALTRNKNNKAYYRQTRNELVSGKVGKAKTPYQKAIRAMFYGNAAGRAFTRSAIAASGASLQSKQHMKAEMDLMNQYRKNNQRKAFTDAASAAKHNKGLVKKGSAYTKTLLKKYATASI